MNYAYYKKLQMKQLKKNIIFITCILVIATLSTYFIYNDFKEERDKILNSKSIEVIYHEKEGNKIDITKVTPVSDYVGLSSKIYSFTVKNNSNKTVEYTIRIVENKDEIEKDDCKSNQIPLNIIKVAIHEKGEVSDIYNMDDIDNGVIRTVKLKPKEEKDYKMRFWISNDITTTINNKLHYHGLIDVKEK